MLYESWLSVARQKGAVIREAAPDSLVVFLPSRLSVSEVVEATIALTKACSDGGIDGYDALPVEGGTLVRIHPD